MRHNHCLIILVPLASSWWILANSQLEEDQPIRHIAPPKIYNQRTNHFENFDDFIDKECKDFHTLRTHCEDFVIRKNFFEDQAYFYKILKEQDEILTKAISNQEKLSIYGHHVPATYRKEAESLSHLIDSLISIKEEYMQTADDISSGKHSLMSMWHEEYEVPAILPPGFGFKSFSMFTDHPLDHISRFIFTRGFWEEGKTITILNIMNSLTQTHFQDEIFVDIGANIGWFSLAVSCQGHHTIAVEPKRSNFEKIKASAKLNDIDEKITVYHVASSDRSRSEVCLNKVQNGLNNPSNAQINLTADSTEGGSQFECDEIVQTAKLDDLLAPGLQSGLGVRVMKMDIEGHEALAALGANQLMTSVGAPCYVFSEFHYWESLEMYPVEEFQSEYYFLFEVMVKMYHYEAYLEDGTQIPHTVLRDKEHPLWRKYSDFVFQKLSPTRWCEDPFTALRPQQLFMTPKEFLGQLDF